MKRQQFPLLSSPCLLVSLSPCLLVCRPRSGAGRRSTTARPERRWRTSTAPGRTTPRMPRAIPIVRSAASAGPPGGPATKGQREHGKAGREPVDRLLIHRGDAEEDQRRQSVERMPQLAANEKIGQRHHEKQADDAGQHAGERQQRRPAGQPRHGERQQAAERHGVFVVRRPQAVERLLPRPGLGKDLKIVLAQHRPEQRPGVGSSAARKAAIQKDEG